VASGLNIAAVAGETLETSANKSYQVMVKADSGIQIRSKTSPASASPVRRRLGDACGAALLDGDKEAPIRRPSSVSKRRSPPCWIS